MSIMEPTKRESGKLVDMKERAPYSTKIFTHAEHRQLSIVSYIGKKKEDPQNVLLLTTHPRPIYGVTRDDGKTKPAQLKLYDYIKSGVCVVDNQKDNLTVKATTNQWTMCALFYILDVARVNAQTIRSLNNGLTHADLKNSFELSYELAKAMCVPLIFRRIQNPTGITWALLDVMNRLTRNVESEVMSSPEVTGRLKAFRDSVIISISKQQNLKTPPKPPQLGQIQPQKQKSALPVCPKKIDARRYCRACYREKGGSVKELPRSRHLCEVCEEPVCWTKHAFLRCPECNLL